MEKDMVIILAESDVSQLSMFIRNLKQAGVDNDILHLHRAVAMMRQDIEKIAPILLMLVILMKSRSQK